MYNNSLPLDYARYPVAPELRCRSTLGATQGDWGCAGRCSAPKYDTSRMRPGVPYKNGAPFNPNCDYISAPYSMPYEALNCPQCQPPYQAACNPFVDKCKCRKRAMLDNNEIAYEPYLRK